MGHELTLEAPVTFPARMPGEHPIARLRLFALLVIVFVLFSQIGPNPFAEDAASSLIRSSGDLVRQAVLIGLCGLLLFAGWDHKNLWSNVALPASLLVLLAYCLISISWAIDPAIAIRRLVLTAITMWFLYRAVSLLGYAYLLECLRIALGVLLVINYATVLLSSHGVHTFTLDTEDSVLGAWRGILDHKNIAGSVCALTILMFMFDRRGTDQALRWSVIALAAVFLWFTESKTSMSALVIAIGAGMVLPFLAEFHRSFRVVIMVLGAIGVLLVVSVFMDDFTTALNDPGSFTGRSQIWQILIEYARTHLWLGAGFGSFWQIGNAAPVWQYTNGWVAEATGAGHNGYLDLLVTIGLPGLVLTVIVMFLLPVGRLWLSETMPRPQRGLILALIIFVLVHNLAESQLMDRTSFDQQILVLALAFIGTDRAAPSLGRRLLGRIAIARERALA